MVHRPDGDGPFSLVVINHGKPRDARLMVRSMRPAFDSAAAWFVEHGFAVVMPMRGGYGPSQGEINDLATGDCDHRDYFTSAHVHAPDVEGVVADMQRFVDPNDGYRSRPFLGRFGRSRRCLRCPPGVIRILNFAGGGGSFAPGQICGGPARLIDQVGRLGAGVRIPQIWLYAENDQYFAPPSAMFETYRASAQAQITSNLPPFECDDHFTITASDPALWGPAIVKFLAGLPARN